METHSIAKIASHLADWETPVVEREIFGTGDASTIAQRLDDFCRRELGAAISDVLFYQSSVGAVAGLRLYDGREVVVKAHQPNWSCERLQETVALQSKIASELKLAPQVLMRPTQLGKGFATVEQLIDRGTIRNGHDPATRRSLAVSLHAMIECLEPMACASTLDSFLSTTDPRVQLWPTPHSKLFDFEATKRGAEYIDTLAAEAKARVSLVGRVAIGHCDWRAEHVRFDHDSPTIAYDWDSLCKDREPAIVGAVAHLFCSDWSQDEIPHAPTLDEAKAFVSDYESAMGRSFSKEERVLCGAVFADSIGYTARCGHCSGVDRRDVIGSHEHLIHSEGRRLLSL